MDTVATEAPPLVPPRRPLPLGRLLAVGGILLAVVILAGAAYRLSRGWSQPQAPAPQVAAAANPTQAQAAKLRDDADRSMRRGEFGKAVDLYRQAEQLLPGDDGLRRQRELAELQLQDFPNLVNQEKAIAANLSGAQRALTQKKYDQAIGLANLVLGMEPESEEAKAVLAKAQQGKARLAKQATAEQPGTPAPGEEVAVTPAAGEAQPAGHGGAGTAEVQTSSLQVHFQSEIDAVLIVRVNNREVMRHDFSRGSFFWQRRGSQGYNLTKTIGDLPPGNSKVVVHVAPKRLGARIKQLDATFVSGGTRRLEIYLSKSAELTARWV